MGANLTISIPAGTHIEAAVIALIDAANASGTEAVASFNGVDVAALPGDDPARVVASFDQAMAASAAKWRASPEGRAATRASAAEVKALQVRADQLARIVHTLDFSNHTVVVNFLAAIQSCSDRIGVTVANQEIAAAFAAAGLTPNMCTGDAFNGEDEETFFRWLVGQALDGLTRGPAIHGIFHKFAAEWRAKWGPA